jgi:hypothetical protein
METLGQISAEIDSHDHAELFEISVGEVRQYFCGDFVLAKRAFVLAETEVPQPSPYALLMKRIRLQFTNVPRTAKRKQTQRNPLLRRS